MRRYSSGITAAGLFALSIAAGCGAAGGPQPAVPPSAPAGVSRSAGSSHHLYVADEGSGAIYRYALVNGLPQTSPDEIFAKVPGVEFLGVDRSGHIYGAGTTGNDGFVQEFSPSGKLLGQAQLGFPVQAFAVGLAGYMYVSPNTYGSQAFTYSPKALHESGTAQPIATLTANGAHNADDFVSLAEDANGRLYAAAFGGINIYNHPHHTSSQDFTLGKPLRGWSPYFGGALAFDEHARLYADVQYLDYCSGRRCAKYWWHLTDFDAISGQGRHRNDRWVLAKNCYTFTTAPPGKVSGNVTGMAVFGGYIDAACAWDYDYKRSVWVYQADAFGQHQAPIEMLGGVTKPTDVKIGP